MLTERIANGITECIGVAGYLAFAFALMILVPFGILAATAAVAARDQRRVRHGFLMGTGLAAWCSVCWLTVPYCGAYPNLIALFIQDLIQIPNQSVAQELCVHITNFTVWPILGCLSFALLNMADKYRLW